MTSIISNIANTTASVMQSLPKVRLSSPTEMIKKATKVAIPVMALAALSQAQGAEALGTITCIICLASGGGPACVIPCALAIITSPVQGF